MFNQSFPEMTLATIAWLKKNLSFAQCEITTLRLLLRIPLISRSPFLSLPANDMRYRWAFGPTCEHEGKYNRKHGPRIEKRCNDVGVKMPVLSPLCAIFIFYSITLPPFPTRTLSVSMHIAG